MSPACIAQVVKSMRCCHCCEYFSVLLVSHCSVHRQFFVNSSSIFIIYAVNIAHVGLSISNRGFAISAGPPGEHAEKVFLFRFFFNLKADNAFL
jgi:hypothetical protein